MFKWLRRKKEKPTVNIGDIHTFKSDNPFTSFDVVVLDTKEGWVQYEFVNGRLVSSLKIPIFLRLYKLKESRVSRDPRPAPTPKPPRKRS